MIRRDAEKSTIIEWARVEKSLGAKWVVETNTGWIYTRAGNIQFRLDFTKTLKSIFPALITPIDDFIERLGGQLAFVE